MHEAAANPYCVALYRGQQVCAGSAWSVNITLGYPAANTCSTKDMLTHYLSKTGSAVNTHAFIHTNFTLPSPLPSPTRLILTSSLLYPRRPAPQISHLFVGLLFLKCNEK